MRKPPSAADSSPRRTSGPSLKSEIGEALAAAGARPLHRLGQNFMIDPAAVAELVRRSGAAPGMRIVEVGPGTGVLTRRLLDAGASVLAVELDQGLARYLEQTLVPRGLVLVQGDALETKNRLHQAIATWSTQGPWRLVANLPYDAALPVILNAVALAHPPEHLVVTVQLEAAQRLCSQPGNDAWGASAVVLQAGGEPKLVRRLGPGSFHPSPRVDSAILTWTWQRTIPVGFGMFCRAVFSARRKVLPGALRDAGIPLEVISMGLAGLDPGRRAENLSAPEWLAVFARLNKHGWSGMKPESQVERRSAKNPFAAHLRPEAHLQPEAQPKPNNGVDHG